MNYQRLYEYRFAKVDQACRTAVWEVIASSIHEQLGQPRRLLDPAAGRGEFINAVPAEERWAIDQVAYDQGYAPGVRSIVSDIFAAEIPNDYFDAIWVSNFLEHLYTQESVATFLEKMYGALAPGGRIAIIGPNFRYCMSEYFDMADHTLVFTHKAIAEHIYAAGFTPERIVPRYLPYSFTGRLPRSSSLVRLYLNTPSAWRVLGKQFLVIGRKD